MNHKTGNFLNRISQLEKEEQVGAIEPPPVKTKKMITKVTVRPNPFYTVLTIDIACNSNMNIIVRMFSEGGRIVKMFSWYLMKGTNVTAMNELSNLGNGKYLLDIIDNQGTVLFSIDLIKE